MKRLLQTDTILMGFAMFSMFFGAGNVIFPLAIGQQTSSHHFSGFLGLFLTAVITPYLGVIAMLLFDGNKAAFFSRLGKWPGFIVALIIMILLGPLGSTPRCIALSYSTLKSFIPGLSIVLFSAVSCGLIFFLTVSKKYIIDLLGAVLTPIFLLSLLIIIIAGIVKGESFTPYDGSHLDTFIYGLKEGYSTMDLLAAFFFSSAILKSIKMKASKTDIKKHADLKLAIKASILGGSLLGLTYLGFSTIAAFHGEGLLFAQKDQLLTLIVQRIAGKGSVILICSTVILACFTTAIALITVFAEFIEEDVLDKKVRYEWILAFSLLMTFFVATFDFNGISLFLIPILKLIYPSLIVLTLVNILYKLYSFKFVKLPVAVMLLITIVTQYFIL